MVHVPNKKISDFTTEQSEHLKQTFARLGTPSNAPTAGVTPPSSNEAMDMNDARDPPSRSGVPPPTENASAAATFALLGDSEQSSPGSRDPTKQQRGKGQ